MIGFELSILNFIQEFLKSEIMDKIMLFVSQIGNKGAIWIVIALILLAIPKYRKVGIMVVIAMILDLLLCNIILKPLIARPRPFNYTDITLILESPLDYSFPSGHTAVSFAATFALYFSKSKFWKYALVLAIIIAFSRMYLYVHFPTDILAGIVVGFICAFMSKQICANMR